MDLIRSGASVNLQVEPTHIEGGTQQTANAQPSLHASSLTPARLSYHSFMSLNAMELQGSASNKQLATLVKELMQSDSLLISPNNQQASVTGVVQYGRKENQNTLVLQAKLNDKSEYDILAVGLRNASGEQVSMRLPSSDGNPEVRQYKLPPENSLLGLPTELKQTIMGHVSGKSKRRLGVYDLDALENSSRMLKFALVGDSLLKSHHDGLKKIIGAVNRLSIDDLIPFAGSNLFALASVKKREACLAAAIDDLDEPSICSLGCGLETLEPEQRTRLVMAILSVAGLDSEGDIDMDSDEGVTGGMIGSLGAGLHTITGHHAAVIDAVLQLQESDMAWAIDGLGRGLHALDTIFRERLVQATLNMVDEECKGRAIGGLGRGLSALTAQQRSAVLDAGLRIEDHYVFCEEVLIGLSTGLRAFMPGQQRELADAVSALGDEGEQEHAFRSLGPALKNIVGSQYVYLLETLCKSALSMESEHNKALALGGLGRGLHLEEHLETLTSHKLAQLTSNIVSNVLGVVNEHDKSLAIAGLGGGLAALTNEQRERVINACLDITDEADKSRAIAGLGAGLQALTFSQQESLINACLDIASGDYKSQGLSGLGTGLQALATEQQVKLIDAAVNIDEAYKLRAICGLSDVEDRQQYHRLIEAALSLLPKGGLGSVSAQGVALASLTNRHSA